MRKLMSIIAILVTCFVQSNAQETTLKSGVVFRKLFLDYQSQNGGGLGTFKEYRHGYELGYQHMFNQNFGLRVPVRYGVINARIDSVSGFKKRVASMDLQGQYHFARPGKKLIPYIAAGIGGVYESFAELSDDFDGEAVFNIQVPIGLGIRYDISPNVYINWQSEYRFSLAENRNNLVHGIGFVYMIGKKPVEEKIMEELPKLPEVDKDTDSDGIIDKQDNCPSVAGVKELNGCPDRDGDGVSDAQDKCPDIVGLKSFGGCPDTDGDGISDNDDECPKLAGTLANKGCPDKDVMKDSDGDGVSDDDDKCPDEKGSISAMGCPDSDGDGIQDRDDKCPTKKGLKIYNGCPDTDGDGIDDSRDKCPNTSGTVANDGCPEIKQEDKKTLDIAMQAVQFQTSSAVLKSVSFDVLDQIAEILKRYPDFSMSINGHTDNVGSAPANQSLSEKRAKTCYDYLSKRGVSSDRMRFQGYGESRPISTNDTDRGRTLNRRVEFNLVPKQ